MLKESKSSTELEELDLYFRYIYKTIDYSISEYIHSEFSIVLEHIITDHRMHCENYPDCFCSSDVRVLFKFLF